MAGVDRFGGDGHVAADQRVVAFRGRAVERDRCFAVRAVGAAAAWRGLEVHAIVLAELHRVEQVAGWDVSRGGAHGHKTEQGLVLAFRHDV